MPTLSTAVAVAVLAGAAEAGTLGPGAGAWQLADPSTVGLDAAALKQAAAEVALVAPVRYCTGVIADGKLILEVNHANSSSTQYESDSLGKTMIAEVVGVAVHQGLIDLDKPLPAYGLAPDCNRIPLAPIDPTLLSQCSAQYEPLCQEQGTNCDNNVRQCLEVLIAANRSHPGAITGECGRGKFVPSSYTGYSGPESLATAYCMLRAPGQCWVDPHSGADYYQNVTARHILSQATGVGKDPPGTKFTYDSNVFISHLSYLLHKVTGEPPVEWATRNYAVPLGLPDLFAFDGFGEEISAGGGQLMSCRDALRVGQLLLNKGLWPSVDGGPAVRLLDESYVEAMLSPSFPESAPSYGFLTWLNRRSGASECCAPRWECTELEDEVLPKGTSILDDALESTGAPESVGLALGMYAKFMYILPETGLAIITLGQSNGSPTSCMAGDFTLPNGSVAIGRGYDEGYPASLIMRTMLPAVTRNATSRAARKAVPVAPAVDKAFRRGGRILSAVANSGGADATVSAIQRDSGIIGRRGSNIVTPFMSRGRGLVGTGGAASCTCTCPVHNGFGYCMDLDNSSEAGDSCVSVYERASACPAIGVPTQCPYHGTLDDHCATIRMSGMRCSAHRDCAPVTPPIGQNTSSILTASCICWPELFSAETCTWSSSSCDYSPFFPPPP